MHESLQLFLNNKCFSVGRSYGSTLVLEFGNKVEYISPRTGKNYRGEWTLLIKTPNWYLHKNNQQIVNGESDKNEIDEKILVLKDNKILDITDESDKTVFNFENNVYLEVKTDTEMEEWQLFTPDKNVLKVGPEHKTTFSPSNSH